MRVDPSVKCMERRYLSIQRAMGRTIARKTTQAVVNAMPIPGLPVCGSAARLTASRMAAIGAAGIER